MLLPSSIDCGKPLSCAAESADLLLHHLHEFDLFPTGGYAQHTQSHDSRDIGTKTVLILFYIIILI